YMQDNYRPKQFPVLKWIILSTIAVFVLQSIFQSWSKSPMAVAEFFALSRANLGNGFVWTLLSYAFLHGSPFHILGNMLMVFFIGRELVPLLGVKRFSQLYVAAAVVGGLVWLVAGFATSGQTVLIGASGSALGLLTV